MIIVSLRGVAKFWDDVAISATFLAAQIGTLMSFPWKWESRIGKMWIPACAGMTNRETFIIPARLK